MAKPIDLERTGPGNCIFCGEWAERRLKGRCRSCYDQQRRFNNSFSRAEQPKTIRKSRSKWVRIQSLIGELWEDEGATKVEHVTIQRLCDGALGRLRATAEPDLRLQEDEVIMAELELESRNAQPQPDQGELDLQNIPDNPNPVEVEEKSSQPQADPQPVDVDQEPSQPQPDKTEPYQAEVEQKESQPQPDKKEPDKEESSNAEADADKPDKDVA